MKQANHPKLRRVEEAGRQKRGEERGPDSFCSNLALVRIRLPNYQYESVAARMIHEISKLVGRK